MNKSFKPLFEFSIPLEKEVEETNTRIEDGKTISETVKIKRFVNVPFCLKAPSRAEKDEADIIRASWVNKYFERGLMLEAMLIKKYVDEGGTLPKEYQKQYQELQVELLELERKMMEIEILDKNSQELKDMRRRFFDVREQMVDIQRSQAPFFEDTAEAKARLKQVEWLTLNLSYYKPTIKDGELGQWTAFFEGDSFEEKLESYDVMVESLNPLLAKAKSILTFMATALAHESQMTKEQVESYAKQISEN